MKKRKDILFLCQYFYPEVNSSATLPFDTAKYLTRHGKKVDVLCGYPKEYKDNTVNNISLCETKEGVDIQRLRYIQLCRAGKLGRLINYFSFTAAVFFRIFILAEYKCVIVYSNPPILPLVPVVANILFRTKFVFVVYDVYPEVAYASKSLTPKGFLAKVMKKINHFTYKKADMVVALTDEMKKYILQNRPEIDESRICVIENWAHEKKIEPTSDAYEKFGYKKGQFIVTYFGNMGICQDVETMLKAIDLLKKDSRVKFLIAGHGSKKTMVEEKTKDNPNVTVQDYLTGEDYEQAAAISSCSIVSLEKGLIGTCAPSKYYSGLQKGQPILAIVEEKSYLAKEVEREKIGFHIPIGDGKKLSEDILFLLSNEEERKSMANRAKLLYQNNYDITVSMKKYDELISQILKS